MGFIIVLFIICIIYLLNLCKKNGLFDSKIDKSLYVIEKKETLKGVGPKVKTGELSSAGESLQFIALLQGATIFIMIIFYLIVLENPNALAGNYILPFILAGVAIMSIISLHKAGDSLRKADKQNLSNKN